MDKRIAGLLGAAAALTTMTAAHATVPAQSGAPTPPTSYRDLLDPIPNAVAALIADDARLAETPSAVGIQVAEHHHHHRYRRRYRHHHHHHHHHHY